MVVLSMNQFPEDCSLSSDDKNHISGAANGGQSWNSHFARYGWKWPDNLFK